MEFLNKLLSLIPGNGYKTIIGSILAVAGVVQAILATPDGQSLVQALTASKIDWIAVVVLVLGILHKYIKAQVEQTLK